MRFSTIITATLATAVMAAPQEIASVAVEAPPPAGPPAVVVVEGQRARPAPRPYGYSGPHRGGILGDVVGGVAEGVGSIASGFGSAAGGLLEGTASAVGSIGSGLYETGKGILGGTADAIGGVFGVGSDLIEALTGLRPWKQAYTDQVMEIRAALAPINQKYAQL